MVMEFHVRPEVLSGVQVGDTVAFHVTIQGGGGEVTAIRKTP